MSAIFDPNTPSTARMYDYYLRGKDNYPVDRAAAEEVLRRAPSVRRVARDNRDFLARAVGHCASLGIDQFVDVGTGIPTYPNVADVARAVNGRAIIVGVDNDPLVLAHAHAMLDDQQIVDADVRRPDEIIDDPALNGRIDWKRPVAVLMVALLHFVTDNPVGIVAAFRRRMAPGSIVGISHVCSTGADPHRVDAVERIYRRASSPLVFRSRAEILAMFEGFEPVPEKLAPVRTWPHVGRKHTPIPMVGGIGRLPR